MDKEEARPGADLESLPQERRNWRMPELPPIPQGNFLRAEPLPSAGHRSISVPVQNMIQSSKGRGVPISCQPLEGGHELLLTHQELSGSEEDHRALSRMESLLLKRQDQKINNLLKNQSLLSIDQRKELEMTPALERERPIASKSSKPALQKSKDKPKGL
ncbi:hypothetical protein O181_006594 [Austropuccinia psidii MF-1]|uniref:Uncharacterized protein n=1 Tax=Austropuccinia psidii MF-1 TaxID=1389203 RepID=A0A9Q3BKC7_9BASI|nr:hypothetical protein [Austropuccinia psidii MF-1]